MKIIIQKVFAKSCAMSAMRAMRACKVTCPLAHVSTCQKGAII